MRREGKESIYRVADLFRTRCLASDKSLLWPERTAWTAETVREWVDSFIAAPNAGKRPFLEKWREQLGTKSEEIRIIAADAYAVYQLSSTDVRPSTKWSNVETVLSWVTATPDAETLSLLKSAFDEKGVGSAGTQYSISPQAQMGRLGEVAIQLKQNSHGTADMASIRAAFDATLDIVPTSGPMRHVLLHLLFPEYFERISSGGHKRNIVNAFEEHAPAGVTDVDDAIAAIRGRLATELGRPDFDYYDPDVAPRWRTKPKPQARAWAFQASPDHFDLAGALYALEHLTWLVTDYASEIRSGDKVYLWQSGPSAGFLAVGEITSDPVERSMSTDEEPFVRGDKSFFSGDKMRAEIEVTAVLPRPITRDELKSDPLLQRLQVVRVPRGTNFRVSSEQARALDAMIEAMEVAPIGLAELAARCFTSEIILEGWDRLLQDKRQVIIEGAPGTGKTFVAELFAKYIAGVPLDAKSDPRVVTVQFHQSYGYEDFVEGIRPITNASGHLEYQLQDGVFKAFCDRARADARPHVIVIDEINRGNISRIFGELLLLLEYRDKEIPLTYSHGEGGKLFSIPENVYVIGTMNLTDRSLAQIDYALRRRFYFLRVHAVDAGQAGVLSGWLTENVPEPQRSRILALFLELNSRVVSALGEHYEVGHSYLMNKSVADEGTLREIWLHAIIPLLEEYFYNRRDREALLAEFGIDALTAPLLEQEQPLA